jgi:tetratricopeptide (TPR) repeat protein
MLFSFQERDLLELAGDKVFQRGKAYFNAGTVGQIERSAGGYHAAVMGSYLYRASLRWDGGLDGDCDCPAAEDGFCKHQVALGLAVLASASDQPHDAAQGARRGGRAAASKDTGATMAGSSEQGAAIDDDTLLAQWLSSLPQARLMELLIRQAAHDRDQWRALVARARAAQAPPGAQHDAVKTLIGSPRFLDWQRTRQYAQRLESLFDLFDEQATRDPKDTLSLMLFAMKKLLSIYEKVDDSDGAIGDIGQRVGQRILAHAQTFTTPMPALAKEVFALLVIDDWASLHPLASLAPALGPKGMAELRAMAEKRLASQTVPKERRGIEARSYRHAQRILEGVLDACGDLDALIALKQSTLVSGYDYLELAELCLTHGRTRQGIEWLERGIKHAPDEFRLHDRLAQTYCAEGFAQDAIDLLATAFDRQRSRERYATLRKTAIAYGDWPPLRARIDAEIATHKGLSAEARLCLRIQLKLIDADGEGAWALAEGQHLPLHIWSALLPQLERTRPAEAVRVLKTLIDDGLERSYSSRYRDVVEQMKRMTRIAHAHHEVAAKVDACLDEYRSKHARKSKLIAMMAGLSTVETAPASRPRKR